MFRLKTFAKESLDADTMATESIAEKQPMENEPNDGLSCCRKVLLILRTFSFSVTIEPVIFFYVCGLVMNNIITQNLIIQKICLIDKNYTKEICNNLTNLPDVEGQIQNIATKIIMYKTLLEALPTALLAGFIGSWSDKHGRKKLIAFPAFGGFVTAILMALNAYYETQLNVNYILIASLPLAIFGNIQFIMTASVSYIADITEESSYRAVRMAFIQAAVYSGIAIGTIVTGTLADYIGFLGIYAAEGALFLISLLYTITKVKETIIGNATVKEQIRALFELKNIKEFWHTLCKKRKNNGHVHLTLLIFASAISCFPLYSEMNLTYMYVRWRYDWQLQEYTQFASLANLLIPIGLLVFLPVFSLYLKWKDTTIGIFSALSKIFSEIIIANASYGWVLYTALIFYLTNPMLFPIMRSLMSKIVESDEQGKISAITSTVETLLPTFGTIAFTEIYNATREILPGTIYLVTGSMYIIPGIFLFWISFNAKKHSESAKL